MNKKDAINKRLWLLLGRQDTLIGGVIPTSLVIN
jgi:hypothetical protein